MSIDTLNAKFLVPGAARFDEGDGGLTRLTLTTPSGAAEVYLHGAHVTRYRRPHEQPILWMSEKSWYQTGKPIRGGVPVIFPWFGARKDAPASPPAPPSPNHGFARLMPWKPESIAMRDDGRVEAILSLTDTPETRAVWPHAFELRFRVAVGNTLQMSLEVRNIGDKPFVYEEGLHTYFHVGDIKQVRVTGLEETPFIDKVGGVPHVDPSHNPIVFAGETDRVYLPTKAECVIEDASLLRRIRVRKQGSDATVVWNPWIAKAKAMPDFGDDEWTGMVCVETVNVADYAVGIKPGQTHTMSAEIG